MGDGDCTGMSLDTACDPALGGCMPECGTILACETSEDCFVADPEAFCVPTRGGSSLSVGGFCETATIPLTYCERTGFVEDVDFIDCHTLPYSDTLTSSWFDGDCDGDGCPNGADDDVCAASSGCGPATAPLRICPRRLIGVGPEQCTFGSSAGATVLSCATAHSCASDRMDCPDVGFMCRDGMCEPTICGSLYGCRQASDCEGTPFGPGTCVRAPDAFAPAPEGPDGFCAFSTYRTDARCAPTIGDCTRTPFGATTLDFFAGDCDSDGCPNGADDSVCVAGFTSCPATLSLACGTMLQARVDAGVPFLDAGASVDAGVPLDAPAPPQVSFAGGGGCRCGVGRPTLSPLLGPLLPTVLVGLLLALTRRRL